MILPFFRQCNYKCTKENSLRDGGTSQCTSNPVSTKLNLPSLALLSVAVSPGAVHGAGGERLQGDQLRPSLQANEARLPLALGDDLHRTAGLGGLRNSFGNGD